MPNFGFVKVAAAIPNVEVANCKFNAERIESLIVKAAEKHVQIVCFPELSITAYTCADLFHQELLISEAEQYLLQLVKNTSHLNIIAIVGMPLRHDNALFNVAVVFQQGKILGIVPKTYLPNYNEFYEYRWFASADRFLSDHFSINGQKIPAGVNTLFRSGNACFGIEICEDLWVPSSPGVSHALAGANIVFNLSATNELISKNNYLKQLVQQQSAKSVSGYVYASAGFGESTTDIIFAGNGYVVENGSMLAASERFSMEEQLIVSEIDIERLINERQKTTSFMQNVANVTKSLQYNTIEVNLPDYELKRLSRHVSPHPFIPPTTMMDERCNEIFNIQVWGLVTRLKHTGLKSVTIGISGGLDSTLALLVCIKAFDKLQISRQNIVGVTMPGFGTTDQTYTNAIDMMKHLGVTIREISIKEATLQHFKDIGHPVDKHDVTFENSQARERTQILMDIANQTNGLVIGTGDLSELALGWATYNGDHMSMYAVNVSIPKTLIRYLVRWVAETEPDARQTLLDVLDTPVSPELLPATDGKISQKTEDLVGPYELHDFYLYYMLRFGFTPAKIFFMACQAFEGMYDKDTIKKWMQVFFRRFFAQQFKRSCLPDGPKVGSICVSPRGDWRMPSDASSTLWLRQIEEL